MRILFIGNSRIGDFVLSTGLLAHLIERYPDAHFTIACGAAVAPLLVAVPRLERVLPMVKQRYFRHWLGLWRDVVTTRWDLVVDLRNSVVSHAIRADRVCRPGPTLKDRHRVEEAAAVLGLAMPPSPRIWLDAALQDKADARRITGALAIAPGATGAAKQWPADRFAALALALTDPGGPLAGAPVVVVGSAAERDTAATVLSALGSRGIDLAGQAGLAEVAACLKRCALFVGNDGGLMHIAAAMGTPTVGLFGPTPADRYGPWGPRAVAVRCPIPFERLAADMWAGRALDSTLMGSLEVETVRAAAVALLLRVRAPDRDGGEKAARDRVKNRPTDPGQRVATVLPSR